MKHWAEYDPNASISTNVTFGVNPKLWHYIEQTRGDKPRAQYIREILIKIMKNTQVSYPSEAKKK